LKKDIMWLILLEEIVDYCMQLNIKID
jgi:hypothetical protein